MPYVESGMGYRLWFETSGPRGGEPLLLLHGFTGTHSTWRFLRPALSNRFLIAPDLPGHGKSGASRRAEAMGVGATSDALLRLLDRLRVERTALLGYSMGGRVALDLALRHPHRVSTLILESASPGIQDPGERKRRRADDEALADEVEKRGLAWFVGRWEENPTFATQKALDGAARNAVRRERMSNKKHGIAMSLRSAGAGRMVPLWEKLGLLEVPVLLIAGELDGKFKAIGGSMKERIGNCSLALVEGAGHAVHIERPDRFEELVGHFLEAYPKVRGRGSR